MNFVINIPGDRVIGRVNKADMEGMSARRSWCVENAALHYLEYRHDPETGRDFIALVYELPKAER